MINVIGLGYIGLPTALMLQTGGTQVIGTDVDPEKTNQLNAGNITFEEKGLCELFQEAVKKGIVFTTAYKQADVYLIAVPTPYNKRSRKIDPSYVVAAVKKVLEVCPDEAIIIIESTISPNTIDHFIRPIAKGKAVHFVHAPERIIPGNMIHELRHNARIIGADTVEIAEKVKAIYATFCKGEIVLTDIRTAEMSKVAENTYRDINIAYANELAMICNTSGLDVYEVIKVANMHPRVNILQPGPGVGGHCISIDPWFLVGDYPDIVHVIKAAREVNDAMPEYILEKIAEIMDKNNIKDLKKVGLYGLTYKENIDDIRESPTLQLLTSMKRHLACGIGVYDPYIQYDVVENQYHSLDKFIEDMELIVIMVAHDEIIKHQEKMRDRLVFDTRGRLSLQNIYRL